ncbi:MAG: hypothetical protein KF779_16760 [Hyphomonadaceae bacterium]|nr:hypothetical protein [Hyphomonadaceae bacterium]
MTERPQVHTKLSHDAAIVIAGMLADYFHAGAGPLAERITRVQEVALSELLGRLEDCRSVSPIALEAEFVVELSAASKRIEEANWPSDAQ